MFTRKWSRIHPIDETDLLGQLQFFQSTAQIRLETASRVRQVSSIRAVCSGIPSSLAGRSRNRERASCRSKNRSGAAFS